MEDVYSWQRICLPFSSYIIQTLSIERIQCAGKRENNLCRESELKGGREGVVQLVPLGCNVSFRKQQIRKLFLKKGKTVVVITLDTKI